MGNAELKSIMSDGYDAYVLFIGNELKSVLSKDTVHQVCMSHAKLGYLNTTKYLCRKLESINILKVHVAKTEILRTGL